MNLMVKTAENTSKGPSMATGVKQPPTRVFMNDMTITAKSSIEGRWMLEDLEHQVLFTWTRMTFKPAKCRSLVLKKGRVQDNTSFKIRGKLNLTVAEQPVKNLGKWFDRSLRDKNSVKKMVKQSDECMETIDKSGLPGKYKAWCYQHGVLPRLLWPLLMYNVSMTKVETYGRPNFLVWGLPLEK
jgi:hypothetical protein